MKLHALAVAALVALSGSAFAQTAAPSTKANEPVKAEHKGSTVKSDKKAKVEHKGAADHKGAAKVDTAPKAGATK